MFIIICSGMLPVNVLVHMISDTSSLCVSPIYLN